MSYNHDKTKTAYEAWYGKKHHWNMLRFFGCDVYVVNETRTKNTLVKATCHKFLGWGSSTSMIHYLDTSTHNIKRARHVYFDDFSSATPYDKLSPGGILLRNESLPPTQPDSKSSDTVDKTETFLHNKDSSITLPLASLPSPLVPKINNTVVNFHNLPETDPFKDLKQHTYQVDFSCHKIYPFGIFISYNDSTSPWYINLPPKLRRNVFILGIESIEPITPSTAYDSIEYNVKNNKFLLSIILCKWQPTTRAAFETP